MMYDFTSEKMVDEPAKKLEEDSGYKEVNDHSIINEDVAKFMGTFGNMNYEGDCNFGITDASRRDDATAE